MSILLEALKKSEQQRQLGQTPTLQTPLEETPSAQISLNHWAPLSLLALSVVVMAWFGWQQFRVPEPTGSEIIPAVAAQSTGEPKPRTPTESFQSDSESPDNPTAPSRANVRETEDKRARLNQSFNNFTAENNVAEKAMQEDVHSRVDEIEPRTIPEPEPGAAMVGPGPSMADPSQAGPASDQFADESIARDLEPHISEPISYWELPQGVRDDLPEIKITVLVYSEKQEDRFLLTNGQRMAEKDTLEGGVLLDEIRRDGAVFVYRKYRFLVKG